MRFRRRRGLGGKGRDRDRGSGDRDGEGGGGDGARAALDSRLVGWAVFVAVAGLLFGGGYLAASQWLFPGSRSVAEGEVTQVPDLVGLTDDEARSSLEAAGLEFRVGTELSHPRAPEGAVLAQSPLPGGFARPGAPVEVTLSLGPEQRRVPNLQGLSGRQGRLVLERLEFRVSEDSVRSPVERGHVVGTRPQAGTRLTVPSTVTLVVSQGPQVGEVPDLVGRHVDDVPNVLEEAGFRLGEVSYDPEAFAADGRVVAQSPTAGYALRLGARVSVQVAGAPPERPSGGELPPGGGADAGSTAGGG